MEPLLNQLNHQLTKLWHEKFEGVLTVAFDKGLITGFWQVDGTLADIGISRLRTNGSRQGGTQDARVEDRQRRSKYGQSE